MSMMEMILGAMLGPHKLRGIGDGEVCMDLGRRDAPEIRGWDPIPQAR